MTPIELQDIEVSIKDIGSNHNKDEVSDVVNEQGTTDKGNYLNIPLLATSQDAVDKSPANNNDSGLSPKKSDPPNKKKHSEKKLTRMLKKRIFWKLRLWMVIALILLFIIVIIILSIVICSVIHEDVDEKYDLALFVVPRYFNGSFKLNQNFTVDQLSPESNPTQVLSSRLQQKLCDLYTASPGLGRYFSSSQISVLSNGSAVVHFWLTFLMPEEHSQLERFTLSREMVSSVLRQHLYDQDPDEADNLYIYPASLSMKVSNMSVIGQ